MRVHIPITFIALAAGSVVVCADPGNLTITVTNTQAAGGFAFSPFWFGSHDSSFDLFNSGSSASMFPGVTSIAELADTSALTTHFSSVQPNGTQLTFAEPNGAPVFTPGESASINLSVSDTSMQRYLSYMSMVVPSNDLFVGSDNAIELYDAMGNFNGPVTINIFGSNVYDNGSEVNNIQNGGAFIMGVNAMLGDDENGNIHQFLSDPNSGNYISSIIGLTNGAGMTMTTGFDDTTLLGTITIVPAPSSIALLGAFAPIAMRRRR
ncbi:MAG: spondin domain-containing protein [Phycisphaeraceae bacterium]|nr:spondin domain-containing protein [Phycisphaerales bacterium]MCB9861516.1 spondin domain-containing protein [Phycisphaeraceae bacterium]